MLYLLLLTVVSAAVWRLATALHRLWRSVPDSNRDFSLE